MATTRKGTTAEEAVAWLRAKGTRKTLDGMARYGKRNPSLRAAALRLAEQLAGSEHPGQAKIGRHAKKELGGP